MNHALRTPPAHLQQAQAALAEAGIPLAAGTKALALAAHFYHHTPQVSLTDAMRQERNLIQDELETVSSQLQQERRKTQRLEQELAAARGLPSVHQNKAYKLRKQLRAILAVLEHHQAKETTKLTSIAQLAAGALAGEEDPAQEALAEEFGGGTTRRGVDAPTQGGPVRAAPCQPAHDQPGGEQEPTSR